MGNKNGNICYSRNIYSAAPTTSTVNVDMDDGSRLLHWSNHRIAYLYERPSALFGLLARRSLRNAHEGLLATETHDRLRACNMNKIPSSEGGMGDGRKLVEMVFL